LLGLHISSRETSHFRVFEGGSGADPYLAASSVF
jgi:hypothetical protein